LFKQNRPAECLH